MIRHQNAVLRDFQLRDAGAAIDVPILVKNEVPETVIDVFSMILLDGLQSVRMVTNQRIGTGIDEATGDVALHRSRFQGVFLSPMQRHYDNSGTVFLAQRTDANQHGINGFLIDGGLFGEIWEMLKRQLQGGY